MEKEYKNQEELSIGKSKIDKIIPAGSNLPDNFNLSDKIWCPNGFKCNLDTKVLYVEDVAKSFRIIKNLIMNCRNIDLEIREFLIKDINEIAGDKLLK